MGSPRTSAGRGFSHSGGSLEAGRLPGCVIVVGDTRGYGSTSSVSPHPKHQVRSLGHPLRHVPSLAGAVEAFFANRDLAAATRRTYRQALTPLVEAAGDRPVSSLDPELVTAVFTARWDGYAAATWKHPEGRGAGLHLMVSGTVAAGRRSAGRSSATPLAGR